MDLLESPNYIPKILEKSNEEKKGEKNADFKTENLTTDPMNSKAEGQVTGIYDET